MGLKVLGIGTANPAHTMSQEEATRLAIDLGGVNEREQRVLNVLYRRSGVTNRYTVLPHRIALQWADVEDDGDGTGAGRRCLGPTTRERMEFYEQHAAPLASEAVRRALERSGKAADDVTHLVTVSCTGFVAPGVDVDLMLRHGLSPTTNRVNVGFMGCHGAINGQRVALALAESIPRSCILLCAVECCSLHYRFQWDPERFIGNALFADGAAALVGVGNRADENPCPPLHLVATGSCLIPDSTDAMTWSVGDNGFEMFLSAKVPDLIERHLRTWLANWLAGHDLSVEAVNGWAVHPGGPRILLAVQNSLKLAREDLAASHEVLEAYGNMSSPTVLFILNRLSEQGVPRPYVALGFGPGLIAEAALYV